MRGQYDNALPWPFKANVTLILVGKSSFRRKYFMGVKSLCVFIIFVDQCKQEHIIQTFKPTPESSSFQKPGTDMNEASGYAKFADLSVLVDPRYVKEDTMFIKCIVDTTRISLP